VDEQNLAHQLALYRAGEADLPQIFWADLMNELNVTTDLAGSVSIEELAARWVRSQTPGQVPGFASSVRDEPPTGTPGNVT
jgi:hypothetical protein